MKKILLLIITLLLIIIIYFKNYNDHKYITIIGDGIASGISDKKITYNFTDELINNNPSLNFKIILKKDYRLKDLNNDIKTNKKYNQETFQHILKNSKSIVLFLGMEDIYNQTSNKVSKDEIISNIINDYSELINSIKHFNNNIIIVNCILNNQIDIEQINEHLNTLAIETNIEVVTTNDIRITEKYLSYQDHIKIFNKINEYLKSSSKFDKIK